MHLQETAVDKSTVVVSNFLFLSFFFFFLFLLSLFLSFSLVFSVVPCLELFVLHLLRWED